MKICHLTAFNGSGMHAVAKTMATAEKQAGLDSHLVNVHETAESEWDKYSDADVYVTHTHFPNQLRKRITRSLKMVFVSHGTPEYIVQSTLEESQKGYGHGDGLQLWMHWMRVSDAIVTFWPRHQAIMQSMCDKRTKVECVPFGLELDFWKAGRSRGKFGGNPSVMIAENGHWLKWPFDMFVCWPWVYEQVPDATLHAAYVPQDQHRVYFPIVNRNSCHYGAHISPVKWAPDELRHVLNSIDFYVNLVRYGDFNRIGMEAAVCGAKVISYEGNPYSHYWIKEGDQRGMAAELIRIFKGEVEPREPQAVPDASETTAVMKGIYESLF